MALNGIGKQVVAVTVIGLMVVGCKPKPIDVVGSQPAADPAVVNTPTQPTSISPSQAPSRLSAPAQVMPAVDDHQHHEHASSNEAGNINDVAERLSPQTKAQLEQLIEARNQAKPITRELSGGGQVVDLNGSQTSIAVGVADEAGNTVIYHHGEDFRPQADNAQMSEHAQKPVAEKVKSYPPIKPVVAPNQ